MTLEETVHQKVSSWRPNAEGKHSLAIKDESSSWRVRLTADRQDDLSTTLRELSLERPSANVDNVVALQNWAENIVKRTAGHFEPLQVIEVDSERKEALIRSKTPTSRQEQSFYFELILKGDREAQLRRYRAAVPGDRREQVAFTLTHEAIARLSAILSGD
jgi:hypothetical protein